jgi:flagellar basal-body rod protein FlgB
MQPVSLFTLASHQARWLSVRQAAVADNIANVNTPGYHAVDVEPFEKVLDGTRVAMQSTNNVHLTAGGMGGDFELKEQNDKIAVLPSDNTVVLENELVRAGEVKRAFELNTAIVKAFHRMIMMTTRG